MDDNIMISNLAPYIGGLIAGVLSSFFGFLMTDWVKARSARRSIARALLAEATASREQYMDLFGNHLEATPDTELPTQRASFREYQIFPIFEKLSQQLGTFPREEAEHLARIYTVATGFALTLRNFSSGMFRLDEIALNVQRSQMLGNRPTETVLVQEFNALRTAQLEFWVRIRQEHQRVTGTLFQELQAILNSYSE